MANKALLVGINKYKIPGVDLNGCANDVTNMRDVLLKYFGFGSKEIRALAPTSLQDAGTTRHQRMHTSAAAITAPSPAMCKHLRDVRGHINK